MDAYHSTAPETEGPSSSDERSDVIRPNMSPISSL